MTGYAFDFNGLRLEARASGALWWPGGGWLIVADLHLGKSERMARRGGPLLPPYEGLATLERLAAEIAALSPAAVISLGDGFDDLAAAGALDAGIAARLADMGRGRDWVWIGGNHDPAAPAAPAHVEAMSQVRLLLSRGTGVKVLDGASLMAFLWRCSHTRDQPKIVAERNSRADTTRQWD